MAEWAGGGQTDRLKLICMDNLLAADVERVYFKDRLGRFLFVSTGWIVAYAPGKSSQELAGKTDFDIFTYEHAYAAFQDEKQVMSTGQPIVGKVERETLPGGREGWVSTTKMPLRDEHHQIIGTFGISRNVAGQVRAESL
jgi:two-component system, sensor histidine kinase and response regulator